MPVSAAPAVKRPAFAAAPPVAQVPVSPDREDAPRRLISSLSAVPAVQRKCGPCEDEETLVMPRLEVGAVNDPHEREADDSAGQVMTMRAGDTVRRQAKEEEEEVLARRLGPSVQRQSEEGEDEVMARGIGVQRKCAARAAEQTPVMPRLEVGAVDDPHEREADDIAGQVMAMRSSDTVQRQAEEGEDEVMALRFGVQRKCAACEAEDDDMPVRPRLAAPMVRRALAPLLDSDALADLADLAGVPRMTAGPGTGGEHITASAAELTSGGQALSSETRGFFEDRMGRDLGDVRVHDGGAPDALNASIRSRAFTYRNHIWLSGSERAAPSFTMAHELAHVLQQTQPDAVQAKVRRMYWQPAGGLGGWHATDRHSGYHTELQQALHDAHGTSCEVRIPNAKASGSAPGHYGFADLYWSDNGKVPGLRQNAAGNVINFDQREEPVDWRNWKTHPTIPGGDFHYRSRYPRKNAAGAITHCDKAPSEIEIGDVKPGHNEKARADGVTQINHYLQGIKDVAAATSKMSGGCWTVKSAKVMGTGRVKSIPAAWDATRNWRDKPFEASIELRDGSTIHTPKSAIRGRRAAAKDPVSGHDGIWVYFIQPSLVDLERATDLKGVPDTDLEKASKRLDVVLKCLRASPKKAPKVCRRPRVAPATDKAARRLPAGRAVRAAPGRAKVRRAPPRKDENFDVGAWNALRTGSKKAKYAEQDRVNLKDALAADATDAVRGTIKFRRAMLTGNTKAQEQFGDKQPLPKGMTAALQQQIEAQGKLVEKLEFWSSGDASKLGLLRKVFGTAFVRVMDAVAAFKKKFHNIAKRAKVKGASGGLAKAAVKAFVKVLMGMSAGVMRKVQATVLGCIQSGFEGFMDKMTQGSVIEDLKAQAAEAQEFYTTLGDEVLADVEARIDAAIKPIQDVMDEFGSIAGFIGRMAGIASKIAQGIRGATCLSGLSGAGVGAIITCLVAAGDFVLSLFGASPIDWLAGKLIQSCPNRRLMARGMLEFDEIRTMPTWVSKKILTTLKSSVKAPLDEMFCDIDAIKAPDMSMDDFSCDTSGGLGLDDSGGGGGGDGEGARPAAKAGKGEGGGEGGKTGEDAGAEGGGTPSGGDGEEGGLPSVTDLPPPVDEEEGAGLPSVDDLPPPKEDGRGEQSGKPDVSQNDAPEPSVDEEKTDTPPGPPAPVGKQADESDEEAPRRGKDGVQSIREGELKFAKGTTTTYTVITTLDGQRFEQRKYPKAESETVMMKCVEVVDGGLTFGPHRVVIDPIAVANNEEHGVLLIKYNLKKTYVLKNGDRSIEVAAGEHTAFLRQPE